MAGFSTSGQVEKSPFISSVLSIICANILASSLNSSYNYTMRGLLLCRPITGPRTNRCKAIAVNLALLFSQLIIQQSSTLTTRYKTADEGFEVSSSFGRSYMVEGGLWRPTKSPHGNHKWTRYKPWPISLNLARHTFSEQSTIYVQYCKRRNLDTLFSRKKRNLNSRVNTHWPTNGLSLSRCYLQS